MLRIPEGLRRPAVHDRLLDDPIYAHLTSTFRMKFAPTFIVVCLSSATASLNATDDLGDAVRSAVHSVSSSVVRIQIIGIPDRSGSVASRTTTGVVVSEQGEIVSSSFGFGGQIAGLFVESSNGERHAAEVVAQDHLRKLVLLRCDADSLKVPQWSDETPPAGTWSLAVGRFYPTKTPSAALGVISARERIHGMAIQTDAKVSPVNYGGPLIGLDGQVFGILVPLAPGNESIGVSAGVEWYDSGIGFAIPVTGIQESIAVLRGGKDRHQGLLGVKMDTNNPLSETMLIADVVPGSPAAISGMQSGDIIVAAEGVSVLRVGMLESIIKRSAAGETVRFTIRRDAEQLDLTATLTQTLPVPQSGRIGLVPISTVEQPEDSGDPDDEAQDNHTGGVRCSIVAGSPAAAAGIPETTVITRINDVAVRSTRQLRTIVRQVEAGSKWTLECSTSDTPTESQTFHLTAVPKPPNSPMIAETNIAAIRDIQTAEVSDTVWQERSSDLNDDTHLWMLAPEPKLTGAELGIVILLQDAPPVTDLLKRSWLEVCSRNNLVLAVVSRDNGLPVTQTKVIARILSSVLDSGTLDGDRIVLVSESVHAEFLGQAVANPRIPPLRLGVFLDCRPIIDSRTVDLIRRKRPAFLFLPADADRQFKALLTTSLTALRSAGADVLMIDQSSAGEAPTAELISNWLWTQKIH